MIEKRLEELQTEVMELEDQIGNLDKQMQGLQQGILEASHRRAGALRAIQELQSLVQGDEPPFEVIPAEETL